MEVWDAVAIDFLLSFGREEVFRGRRCEGVETGFGAGEVELALVEGGEVERGALSREERRRKR
jgi:hypothetical protein